MPPRSSLAAPCVRGPRLAAKFAKFVYSPSNRNKLYIPSCRLFPSGRPQNSQELPLRERTGQTQKKVLASQRSSSILSLHKSGLHYTIRAGTSESDLHLQKPRMKEDFATMQRSYLQTIWGCSHTGDSHRRLEIGAHGGQRKSKEKKTKKCQSRKNERKRSDDRKPKQNLIELSSLSDFPLFCHDRRSLGAYCI